ncbi:MAG: SBBP repeat-containing protein [Dehalococcoidia bacterium]|nr:SBBP repeat-containing protein [Dehalococcoidia bacterium]
MTNIVPSLLRNETAGAGVWEIRAPFATGTEEVSKTQSSVGLSGAFNPIYATFLGGSGFDEGNSIAVDGSGNAFVTGQTNSSGFPAALGLGYDTTYNDGGFDAFVVKLNASGPDLVYATFLGGSNYDYGWGVAIDGSGNAYVTGYTASTDCPAALGGYDADYNGAGDSFVVKPITVLVPLECLTVEGPSEVVTVTIPSGFGKNSESGKAHC